VAARAQQPAMPVISFVNSAAYDLDAPQVDAFRNGLGEIGYFDGRNVTIEYSWLGGEYDRLPALVANLVRRRVALIAAGGISVAQAAKIATATIPIVFQTGGDPVEAGLVASLSRPGGNVTGVTTLNLELGPKRLELLHELVPTATIIAYLDNPNNTAGAERMKSLHAAALALGVQLKELHARSDLDFEGVFASLAQMRAGALFISNDLFLISRGRQLAALALRHAVPAIFQYREFAAAGGLMSYGSSLADAYRTVGAYAGRLLKGDKPADLPVQQVTKVELIINMKSAKALGLSFPLTLLGRADEVIE
jgi:putative ABC transport system substrate-binding protein